MVSGKVKETELKELCNQFDCSHTQLIVACLIASVYQCQNILDKKKYPFQVFVPVNLRRFFPSITLRNFSLYVRTKFDLNTEISFPEIIKKSESLLEEPIFPIGKDFSFL